MEESRAAKTDNILTDDESEAVAGGYQAQRVTKNEPGCPRCHHKDGQSKTGNQMYCRYCQREYPLPGQGLIA